MDLVTHPRWSRTEESAAFFCDADALRRGFHFLLAAGVLLLAAIAAGLWRLEEAALAPPVFVGVAHGQVFTGSPLPLSSVREDDFDAQLADTVVTLFGRTEKGQPPEIREFCAPEVVAAVNRDYQDSARKYPAGFVQTLSILEARMVSAEPGRRRASYRALLSSRSVEAAQTSPVYLDCTFEIGRPTALNSTGWRLVRLEAVGPDDFYRKEREEAVRKALQLPAPGKK